MEPERVRRLNDDPPASGTHVLYWMQQSQRAGFNHALEYAVDLADSRDEPLIVGFGLTDGYPDANLRHYAFMLEGLAEVAATLEGRGIAFALRRGDPAEVALALARGGASVVVCDRGYTRHQRGWRERVAREAARAVVEVEADVVVPVDLASAKAEHAARTLRPRLLALRDRFLEPLEERAPKRRSSGGGPGSELDPMHPGRLLDRLAVDRSVGPVTRFRGGTSAARARLKAFLEGHFDGYAERRGEPVARACSEMSPHLHFGQISPVELALAARAARTAGEADKAAYLEELVVRRELTQNFVRHNPAYDRYEGLPAWSRATLAAHAGDPRPVLYDLETLEGAGTHDPYWNAAMREMRLTGYMHNHMRMYWGKKILEWSPTPEEGYARTLGINNKYFLDGRDPNSYANVGWVYGLHDRPWARRPVFGTVRYMNDKGLERKLDIRAYVAWTERLPEAAEDRLGPRRPAPPPTGQPPRARL